MTMDVSDTVPRVHYTATAFQTVFTIPFEFELSEYLGVWVDGVLCTYADPPADNTEFSTTGEATTGGGTLTFGAPGITLGATVVIINAVPIERIGDYPTSGLFPVRSLNSDLDRYTQQLLQVDARQKQRSLTLEEWDSPEAMNKLPVWSVRSNKLLGFDDDGHPEMTDPADIIADAAAVAEAYANAAAASAALASGFATSASGSATAASGYATTASGYATAAGVSETNAAASAASASGFATAASGSATAASGSAAAAAVSAEAAENASASMPYTFDSATADADPGNGKFRLNHATPASATAIYIDDLDADGVNMAGMLNTFDDSTTTIKGVLQIRDASDSAVKYFYNVTGNVVDGTGYRKVTIAYVSGSGTLSDLCLISFSRTGDSGAGAGDVVGPASSVADQIALFDGTSGKLLKTGQTLAQVLTDTALAGNPTAATQSAGNNTTRIATTAFVTAAINVILGGVSSAFDTLSEIATELGLKAPSSRTISTQHSLTGGGDLSANRTLNLVNDTASPGNSKLYGTDSGGTRGWFDQPAGMAAATQAEQEAASSTTVAVTPGRQHFHPSAAKFWCKCNGAGTTINASYNMTSLTDTGAGNVVFNIATDFSSTDWAAVVSLRATPDFGANNYVNPFPMISAQAAGTLTVQSVQLVIDSSAVGSQQVAAADPLSYYAIGFGDHA